MPFSNPGTVAGSLFDTELFAGAPETFGGGGSRLPMYEEGMPYRNTGSPIAGNGADTTDDVLDGFQFPPGTFDIAGRAVTCTFQGNFGATINQKRVRVWLNPTLTGATITAAGKISGGQATLGSGVLLYDSGTVASNNLGWQVIVDLSKTGSFGSNTQNFQNAAMIGTTHNGTSLMTTATQPENAAWQIVVTGASQTTGAANDVTLWGTAFNANN